MFIEPEIVGYLPKEETGWEYSTPIVQHGTFKKRMLPMEVAYVLEVNQSSRNKRFEGLSHQQNRDLQKLILSL